MSGSSASESATSPACHAPPRRAAPRRVALLGPVVHNTGTIARLAGMFLLVLSVARKPRQREIPLDVPLGGSDANEELRRQDWETRTTGLEYQGPGRGQQRQEPSRQTNSEPQRAASRM